MALKPLRWCPSCATTHKGVCPKRKGWSTGKRTGSGRGGRPWRRTRQRIFERDNYLCQEHLRKGRPVPVGLSGPSAGVCDHVVPLAEGGTDDDDNLQTLCRECSDAKTLAESQRARGASKL